MKKLFAPVFTTFLCALAAAALSAPAAWAANDTDGDVDESSYANLLSGDVNRDVATSTNPYGYDKGVPFMLTSYDELAIDLSKESDSSITAHGGYKYSSTARPEEYSSYSYNRSASTKIGGYRFVQEVAFDPTCSGRNDHIAYVGINDSGNVCVWVYNTQSGATSNVLTAAQGASWVSSEAEAWSVENYLAITAGDYDADNKDTFVVYAPKGKGETPLLHEFSLEETDGTLTLKEKNSSSDLLNEALIASGKVNSSSLYVMGASLATGDVNADDVDDLVVYSGSCSNRNDSASVKAEALVPQLSISWGCKGVENVLAKHTVPVGETSTQGVFTKVLWDKQAVSTQQNDDDEELDEKSTAVGMMYCAGVDAGDVDGDKCDEIVLAGYHCNICVKEDGTVSSARANTTNDKLACMVVRYNAVEGTYDTQGIETVQANSWTKSGSYAAAHGLVSRDHVLPQIAVKSFVVDGSIFPEAVFVSGTVYNCSTYTFQESYTPDYFKNFNDKPAELDTVTNTYLLSVTAGNFDNNEVGREQLAFSMGRRVYNLTDDYMYYCKTGILGGCDFADTPATETTEAVHGQAKSYYSITGEDLVSIDAGKFEKMNMNVVAADFKVDGVLARFNSMDTMASDPKVEAVLQAAPFFEELSGTEGETSYGTEQSTEISNGQSNEVSVGVGYAGSYSTPALRWNVEAGVKGGYSHSWENSYKTSYSEKFTAEDVTTVVVNRTEVDTYLYDVYNADTGEWEEKTLAVQALGQPVYTQLTVAQYNAFVDKYNAQADELNSQDFDNYLVPSNTTAAPKKMTDVAKVTKLNKLDGTGFAFLSNEGDPWGYASSWQMGTQVSKGAYAMNSGTGSITSNYSVETGHSTTNAGKAGFDVSVTVQWGAKVGDWDVYNGINVNVSYEHEWSTAKTVTESVETEGTVANVNASKLGISEDIASSYGFEWTLGQWMFTYDDAGSKVPIVGYVVNKLKAPPQPVSDLKARAMGTSSIQLTWTQPSSAVRAAATGYQVFEVKDGSYNLLATLEGADKTSFTVENLESGTKHAYVVTPLNNDGSGSVLYGMYSNKAATTTLELYHTLTFSTDDHCTAVFQHSGNVSISSGDKLLQGIQVHGNVQASSCYAIDSVQVTVDGVSEPVELNDDGTFDFLMEGDVAVAVTTRKVEGKALLTVDAQGPGALTVTDQDGKALASGAELTCGDVLTVKATPKSGYALLGLTVCGKDAEDGCTVQVSDDVDVSATFGKLDLSDAAVKVASRVTYKGRACKPAVKVVLGGATVPASGYTVAYSGNKAPGMARVTITGKGVYAGSVSAAFAVCGSGKSAIGLNAGLGATAGANFLRVAWGKVPGAQGYDVLACAHGKKFGSPIKVARASATQVRIPLSVLGSTSSCYKVKVRAWRMVGGKKVYLEKSLVLHVAKKGAAKQTNALQVWVAKSVRTLHVGGTAKLGARTVKANTKKKLLSAKHAARLCYWSTDKAVATVSKSGKVTARGKGTCKVYAMAQNGKKAVVEVTVK